MKTPWADLFKEILPPIAELERLSPGTVEEKRQLDAAWEKTNVLGAKTRELIAVAVGATTRCSECISRHAQLAVQYGATQEEIAEAVGIAVAINAGTALTYAAKALQAGQEYANSRNDSGRVRL